MLHLRRRLADLAAGVLLGQLHFLRTVEETLCEFGDARRVGGREQQCLMLQRALLGDVDDVVIGSPCRACTVGFVEHQH